GPAPRGPGPPGGNGGGSRALVRRNDSAGALRLIPPPRNPRPTRASRGGRNAEWLDGPRSEVMSVARHPFRCTSKRSAITASVVGQRPAPRPVTTGRAPSSLVISSAFHSPLKRPKG